MPGIAASEPPIRAPLPLLPLLAFTVALSFIDTRCTPSLPLSRSSLSPSPSAQVRSCWTGCNANGLPRTLFSDLSRAFARAHVCVRTCVRAHMCMCASVIGNPGERTYLSTGNKLTSCRKLRVPWEDSPGERVATGGGRECGRPVSGGWRNKKRSFARRPEMRIRSGKTAKTFYFRFIIHGAGFCDKCAVTGKNNECPG